MFRRLQMFALLASGGLVVACADTRETTPTSPEFQLGSGPSCSPSNLKKFAKAVAGTSSQLYQYAQQFTPQNANSVFATNLFFDLAAAAADLARPQTLSSTQRGDLANVLIQGIACANVIVSDPVYSADYVNQFTLATGLTGALEVRGRPAGASENANIFSHNVGAHGSAGVKPPAAGFAAWYGGRVMFYGFDIDGTSDEAPPLGVGTDRIAFEWFTVRPASSSLNTELRGQAALCVLFPLSEVNPAQLRIQRVETILPVGNFQVPCFETSSLFKPRSTQVGSPAARMFAWLRQQLLPQPLLAFSSLGSGTPSGNPKNLSPVEAINPLGATLTYEPPPATGVVSEGLGVTVHATGEALTDWEGLLIKIIAQDNNGRFVLVNPDTATTDASGIADFTTSMINKPGVYKLLAVTLPGPDADATGFVQDSVISANFHRLPN